MPRTFSLPRLLLLVTLFCVICALAVAFPYPVIGLALIAAFVLPVAAVLWLGIRRLSQRPRLLACNVVVGGFIGFILFSPYEWQESILSEILATGLPAAIGAVLFGGLTLLDERIRRRS